MSLTDDQKMWLLKYNGREITSKLIKLLKQEKITLEQYKESFEFWLEQNDVK